jgi:hypothetical protein
MAKTKMHSDKTPQTTRRVFTGFDASLTLGLVALFIGGVSIYLATPPTQCGTLQSLTIVSGGLPILGLMSGFLIGTIRRVRP